MFRAKTSAPSFVKCPGCKVEQPRSVLQERLYVCPNCEQYLPMPSRARIASLADEGSFHELDRNLVSVDPLEFADLKSYRDRLEEARRETGAREAVTTGVCRIRGLKAVLVVFDFAFLGGTMGSVVGEKIANAFEEATRLRVPLVSVTATGGARVQEGMFSLMQMAKVAAAASRHDRHGLAFISVLSDPTFGGVTASFASLGDVILAEPGAQIGFVGPRVIEQTTGVAPPPDSHRAETLLRAGLLDRVVSRQDLPLVVAYLISHLRPQKGSGEAGGHVPRTARRNRLPAWQQVSLARHASRPTSRYYIARMTTNFLELHGDRWMGDDPAIIAGLADLNGRPVVIVAQERGSTPEEKRASHDGMAFSEGYRKAMRLMHLASKYRIPVLTLVDCPTAQASYESEHRGIARALACSLAAMANLPAPIVSVIIGEGGSGGALALAVGDRVLMMEHAIYSVISPEGAAAILYRDAGRAETVSEELKLTAEDLHTLEIIDTVVPEPHGGGHIDPAGAADSLKNHVLAALQEIADVPPRRLLRDRYRKYRHIGRGGVYWREVLRKKIRGSVEALALLVPHKPKAIRPSSNGKGVAVEVELQPKNGSGS